MHVIANFTAPFTNPENIQMHIGVFVVMLSVQPRVGADDCDAQLFVQLTHQCRMGGFAGLNFAAREFPIACIHRIWRALAEQKFSIGALDNRSGDMDGFGCIQSLEMH